MLVWAYLIGKVMFVDPKFWVIILKKNLQKFKCFIINKAKKAEVTVQTGRLAEGESWVQAGNNFVSF